MAHKEVHISTIKPGDTIIHNGHIVTVCKQNIRYSPLMGKTLWGDSYKLGYKPVKLKLL